MFDWLNRKIFQRPANVPARKALLFSDKSPSSRSDFVITLSCIDKRFNVSTKRLAEECAEQLPNVIELGPEKEQMLAYILQFISDGNFNCPNHDVLGVFLVADQFKFERIKKKTAKYLTKYMEPLVAASCFPQLFDRARYECKSSEQSWNKKVLLRSTFGILRDLPKILGDVSCRKVMIETFTVEHIKFIFQSNTFSGLNSSPDLFLRFIFEWTLFDISNRQQYFYLLSEIEKGTKYGTVTSSTLDIKDYVVCNLGTPPFLYEPGAFSETTVAEEATLLCCAASNSYYNNCFVNWEIDCGTVRFEVEVKKCSIWLGIGVARKSIVENKQYNNFVHPYLDTGITMISANNYSWNDNGYTYNNDMAFTTGDVLYFEVDCQANTLTITKKSKSITLKIKPPVYPCIVTQAGESVIFRQQ